MILKANAVNRIWLSLLCLILAVTVMTPVGATKAYAAEGTWYDGTYEGTGTGFRGDITLSVTIADGKISAVEEVSQGETASYWENAKALFDTIVSQQSTQVDSVTGATKSSEGIKAAVDDALAKATIDPDGWYDSGDGTAKNPYVINTAEQLGKFAAAVDGGETLSEQYVALGADINLSEVENWNPIGTEGASATAAKFAGTFDGKDFTIKGMTITDQGTEGEANIGLFSTLDNTAVVKNLNLANVSITIDDSTGVVRAGSIAGDAAGVSGSTPGTVGTVIDRCSVESGNISIATSADVQMFAGGILGRSNTATIMSNIWTDVEVKAETSNIGGKNIYAAGIVGMTGNNSLIVNSSAFGTSYANSPHATNYGGMAGGIGGMLASRMYNTYAMGNATVGNKSSVHKWVGTIAGQLTTSPMQKSGSEYIYPETGAARDFAYYPSDAVLTIEKWNNGQKTDEVVETRGAGYPGTNMNQDKIFETKAKAMDRANMNTQAFADTLNSNLKEVRRVLDAYGYTNVEIYNWALTDAGVLPLGDKWVNTEPDTAMFAGGTGTEEDPYQIKTEEQLRAFAGSLTEGIDYNGYFIKVMNDIDISSADWSPIGGQDYAFDGTFDGSGFTISGMKAGAEENPYVMGRDNPYMGLFGVLGKNARIKNVNLTDVNIYATSPQYIYIGGIAAINDASSEGKKAMIIDNCSVTGNITAVADKSNAFVAGILASQYKGAVINCWTDIDLKCTVKTGNAIAEVGGLVALNNRGLVANCYTLGDVWGSASRNNGDEGMASTGNLVGVNAGDLVGSYSKGNNTTAEYSVYAGELTGWITGIGKVYSCYYNREAVMTIDGRSVVPPADFGTKVAPGVNEEGDAYVGGIVDDLQSYTAADYSGIAAKLNGKYSEYPIDMSIYGVEGPVLNQWKYDNEGSVVTFDTEGEKASTTYKQPQAEIVPPDVEELRDGKWYGRDVDKKVVVEITVENGEVSGEPRIISGDSADAEAVEAAVTRAKTKALYGDTTGYGAADASLFDGGKGTAEDPYLISNEAQLRAIAESLNEDEGFADVYFKQTADIDVSSKDWLPIGHGIMAKVKKAWTQVAAYPFLGNYDGDGYAITGLKIGSPASPTTDPRASFTAGLFGFISGDHYSNAKITEDVRISRIENIKLRDININVSTEGQNYTGGLLGNAQNGFLIDNCSVTGRISSYSKGSFARGAGLAANAIRGSVTNCWTDVTINAETDAGNVYAGGLYAIDNRTTSINCYSLGGIVGNAGANNKVHIGGLSGQCGGVHYNCYTAGNIVSLKTTSDAGLVEGRLAGIAVDSKVYYNSDAKLIVAGTETEPTAIGVSVPENPDVIPKTAEELASQEIVDELNRNVEAATEDVEALQEIIDSQTDLMHVVQFSGNPDDLFPWITSNTPVLKDIRMESRGDEAVADIEQMIDNAGIDPELSEQADKIVEDLRKATEAAKTSEDVDKALADAKAALEQLQEQSDKLKLIKRMAVNELLNHNVSDYSGDNLDKVLDTLLAAQKKIDKAKNTGEVESIIKQTKADVAKIKTDAQIKADKEKAQAKAAAPPTGKTVILNNVANSAKKTNDIIWDKSKVKGATNYEINWKARGAKKWASKTVGNVSRGTATGLSIKGLYEMRVRPKKTVKATGKQVYGSWSNTVYRYFHTTEGIRLKSSSKGSFTMSWKKNAQATGYQVMFTTNKNGAGAAKNISTMGANSTSFTKKGLKSGTTYYVQVREIKKVGNTTYIGNISNIVAVKIK